ncbi:acetyltransferase [Brevibacillus brevis]|uniref:GNAT family N-acetyltransferase n=1 Tax=Brevibacillus brevis TaxID=1393 RepID=UPI0018FF64A4|nr:GNAT family protein [Brevibacillus brevis]MBH0332384.1 acetyltransferase [Brevibacillus brevis]
MNLLSNNFFQGELLRFTSLYPEDVEQLARYTEDYDYLRMVDTDFAVPQNSKCFNNFENSGNKKVVFMLRTVGDNKLIGFIILFKIEWNNQAASLAIGIGEPENRNKGYGTEALKMILRYAFHELNLNRVGLDVIQYNEPAIRAYKKAGFREEGRLRESVLRDGKSYDRIMMGILKKEWEAIHSRDHDH